MIEQPCDPDVGWFLPPDPIEIVVGQIEFVDEQPTGWYRDRFGARTYVIDGEKVDRETWLAYVAAHPDVFSDPKWSDA